MSKSHMGWLIADKINCNQSSLYARVSNCKLSKLFYVFPKKNIKVIGALNIIEGTQLVTVINNVM